MGAFWVVDRFEVGGWAVLENDDGASARVPRSWLPTASREGSVLRIERSARDGPPEDTKASHLRLVVDEAETDRRRKQVEEIRENLPRGPEGDIEL
ncbi:MAG: DUF3006 domain-containing protein [Trueperaceae bacterium]